MSFSYWTECGSLLWFYLTDGFLWDLNAMVKKLVMYSIGKCRNFNWRDNSISGCSVDTCIIILSSTNFTEFVVIFPHYSIPCGVNWFQLLLYHFSAHLWWWLPSPLLQWQYCSFVMDRCITRSYQPTERKQQCTAKNIEPFHTKKS